MHYKKVRKPKFVWKKKATEVLYDKMIFYHEKADEIAKFLIELIEKGKTARGDLLVQIHKEMHRFNDIAIECASKLAPYQSPKLESVEIKQKVTHKFVVKAPPVIPNTKDWLESVQQPLLPAPSTCTFFDKNNGHTIKNNVVDIETTDS